MKNLLLQLILVLSFFACNSEGESSSQNEATTDQVVVGKSYTGRALDRFEQAIKNMEREDSSRIARADDVLFIGSSSIRFWKNLALDFDPIPTINRGFGGSTLPEVIHYADRIIFSYQPKLIVLYCGENDISEGASPQQVFESYKKLDAMIQKRLPDTKLIYLSMKPSVARWNLWDKYEEGNRLIQEAMIKQANRRYIEVADVMLSENGQPDSTIFVEDMLHMNEKGYAAWKDLIRPAVERFYQATE